MYFVLHDGIFRPPATCASAGAHFGRATVSNDPQHAMNLAGPQFATPKAPPRRFRPTPGHCPPALLAATALLCLSQWFRWFPKGWPVLIAAAAVGLVMLAMFLWFVVALVFRRRYQPYPAWPFQSCLCALQ